MVKPTKGQIDDLLGEIRERAAKDERVLVTTLTKKMAEDLTDYLLEQGVRVRYLHSEVDTLRRVELLRELRQGEFDVLVGINLLREGLDLPEVSLVSILDADKEGFLRSSTSLIQTIGRAARNVSGEVHMYADTVTPSMRQAIDETNRRREKQVAYNTERGIDPQPLRKRIADITDLIAREDEDTEALIGGGGRQRSRGKAPVPGHALDRRAGGPARGRPRVAARDRPRRPHPAAHRRRCTRPPRELQFELAARLRDEISELKKELRGMRRRRRADRADARLARRASRRARGTPASLASGVVDAGPEGELVELMRGRSRSGPSRSLGPVLLLLDLGARRPAPARAEPARVRPSGSRSTSALALVFGVVVLLGAAGPDKAGEFLAGWVTEYSLSVDNLFVFVIIMSRFAVPREQPAEGAAGRDHPVAWCCAGACIAAGRGRDRGLQLGLLPLRGFLVYTAVQLLRSHGTERDEEYRENAVIRRAAPGLPISEQLRRGPAASDRVGGAGGCSRRC